MQNRRHGATNVGCKYSFIITCTLLWIVKNKTTFQMPTTCPVLVIFCMCFKSVYITYVFYFAKTLFSCWFSFGSYDIHGWNAKRKEERTCCIWVFVCREAFWHIEAGALHSFLLFFFLDFFSLFYHLQHTISVISRNPPLCWSWIHEQWRCLFFDAACLMLCATTR